MHRERPTRSDSGLGDQRASPLRIAVDVVIDDVRAPAASVLERLAVLCFLSPKIGSSSARLPDARTCPVSAFSAGGGSGVGSGSPPLQALPSPQVIVGGRPLPTPHKTPHKPDRLAVALSKRKPPILL